DVAQLVQRGGRAVIVHGNPVQQLRVGAARAQRGKLLAKQGRGFCHFLLCGIQNGLCHAIPSYCFLGLIWLYCSLFWSEWQDGKAFFAPAGRRAQGCTTVPRGSPAATRRMFSGSSKANTRTAGTWFSRQMARAAASTTFRPRACASA